MDKKQGSNSFFNQVAIVTGAGIGIGFEIARQLAANGAKVVLNDIDQDLAEKASQVISKEGGICSAFAGDISEMSVIQDIIMFSVENFGKYLVSISSNFTVIFSSEKLSLE